MPWARCFNLILFELISTWLSPVDMVHTSAGQALDMLRILHRPLSLCKRRCSTHKAHPPSKRQFCSTNEVVNPYLFSTLSFIKVVLLYAV